MYNPQSEIFDLNSPKTIIPNPTENDYDLGFLIRYFVRKANDENGFIFEVDENQYTKYLENPFWIGAELKWRISGPLNIVYKENGEIEDLGVRNSNKTSIGFTSKTLQNIGLYLPNLLQFYK